MSRHTPSRRHFIAGLGSAALVGIAGCSSQATEQTETETATATATPTATPEDDHSDHDDEGTETATEAHDSHKSTVRMVTDNQGSYFDPVGLLIEPGTTVTFVNASGSHSAEAYHPENGDKPLRIPEDASPWGSELYSEEGATFEHTFEVPGVHDYYCLPHESLGMVARIVVGSPQGGPATEPPEDLPPGATESFPSVDSIVEHELVSGP
jgi:plastocyanin